MPSDPPPAQPVVKRVRDVFWKYREFLLGTGSLGLATLNSYAWYIGTHEWNYFIANGLTFAHLTLMWYSGPFVRWAWAKRCLMVYPHADVAFTVDRVTFYRMLGITYLGFALPEITMSFFGRPIESTFTTPFLFIFGFLHAFFAKVLCNTDIENSNRSDDGAFLDTRRVQFVPLSWDKSGEKRVFVAITSGIGYILGIFSSMAPYLLGAFNLILAHVNLFLWYTTETITATNWHYPAFTYAIRLVTAWLWFSAVYRIKRAAGQPLLAGAIGRPLQRARDSVYLSAFCAASFSTFIGETATRMFRPQDFRSFSFGYSLFFGFPVIIFLLLRFIGVLLRRRKPTEKTDVEQPPVHEEKASDPEKESEQTPAAPEEGPSGDTEPLLDGAGEVPATEAEAEVAEVEEKKVFEKFVVVLAFLGALFEVV